ncbi:hypothetical protein CU098_010339 [Rhizopus stolonifer]|uniref:RING-type E3 ubiquitin transferase n=1 Tax=Rhizopus stolonifer TaxID=4846 RepID=A0A367JWG1_RHIST|nr:hypothetical protein CU098_010339 [Rhizopus stolonifer]
MSKYGKRKRVDIEKQPTEIELKPTCTICLERFENRTFIRPCYHSFCFQCIRHWINIASSQCPVCRQVIDSLVYNVNDEENTFDEYHLKDKGNKKQHDPPLNRIKYNSPEKRIQIERQKVYRGLLKAASYPEPLPQHADFTVLTPDYIPRTRVFLQNEFKNMTGIDSLDEFLVNHLIKILSKPFHEKKTTMYDTDTIQQLSEWLDDDVSIATRLLNELIAYLKSGLSYRHFISAAMYE